MISIKSPELLVACLCADWCGACREYKPLFDSLGRKFPNVRFFWVDVEDEADLIDPIEVEDFPTILIAKGDQSDMSPLFFGTVLPHVETLERLITAKLTEPIRVSNAPDDASLALVQVVKRLSKKLA